MRFAGLGRWMLSIVIGAGLWAAPAPGWAQTWIELLPTGGPPPDPIFGPKPVHYDAASNRLIMFVPGNLSSGGFGNQVWVLTHANGLGGPPVWTQLATTGTPPDSNGHESAVYDAAGNRLIVYGGCRVNCSPARHQVHVLTNANGLGGTPAWSQSVVTNPQARVDHSAVYDPSTDGMVAFGGHFAFFGTDRNDTRILSNASGAASPSTWTTLAAGPPPAIRGQHSAIYDAASNRMTIFAGQNLISTCCPYVISDYNDVWVLLDANGVGAPTWLPLAAAGTPPPVRSGHSASYDPVKNRMIVFGGSQWDQAGQTGHHLGDLWELSHANGLGGTPAWTPIAASGTAPTPRTYHWTAFDAATQRLILVGGRNTEVPPTSNRVWVLVFQREVAIDIKPGSFPNSINPGSRGVIPVAILSDGTFDATTVQPATVRFGPTGTEAAAVHSALEDVDHDGKLDLILHFRTQATGIACGTTSGSLTGTTIGGQAIHGSDSIRTVGCSRLDHRIASSSR